MLLLSFSVNEDVIIARNDTLNSNITSRNQWYFLIIIFQDLGFLSRPMEKKWNHVLWLFKIIVIQ